MGACCLFVTDFCSLAALLRNQLFRGCFALTFVFRVLNHVKVSSHT